MDADKTAATLVEALPHIRRYHGKTIVVKYGGNAMVDPGLKDAFAGDIALLKLVGISPVIVHGGGPQIDSLLRRVGKRSEFVEGLRITDGETLEVVEMVLGGSVNKEITSLLNSHGGKAVGITGKDAGLITAKRMRVPRRGAESLDIGAVGSVERVNTEVIESLRANGFIPVIAPLGLSERGETLNINADTAAAGIASALGAEALILLTNTPGVLDRRGRLVPQLGAAAARRRIASGSIGAGMRPKVECGIRAVTGGVGRCMIIDGTVKHSIILELLTDKGSGTLIAP